MLLLEKQREIILMQNHSLHLKQSTEFISENIITEPHVSYLRKGGKT